MKAIQSSLVGWTGAAMLLALLAPALAAEEKAAPPRNRVEPASAVAPVTWFAQTIAHSQMGLNVTYFWSKGPKMRAETVVAGHKIVTIVHGDRYYAYDVLNGSGVSVRRTAAALAMDAPDRRPFGNELELLVAQGAESVREETVMGRICDVYRITDGRGRREVWMTRGETRLPIRLEIFDRARGINLSTDYLNWQSGLHIADEFFEPQPGVDIKHFELEEYFEYTASNGPAGPVPILYADLIHGPPGRSRR